MSVILQFPLQPAAQRRRDEAIDDLCDALLVVWFAVQRAERSNNMRRVRQLQARADDAVRHALSMGYSRQDLSDRITAMLAIEIEMSLLGGADSAGRVK